MSVHCLDWNVVAPAAVRGGAVTIGNFDGVHRGHAALVAEAQRQAAVLGGPAVALTFDPHPLQLLRPEQFQPVLTTPEGRAALLHAAGADHVVVLRMTREVLGLSAADFLHHVVCTGLGARAVVEGTNFGFGRNREGNIETLAALCREAGLEFTVVQPVLAGGRPVSSSRVRDTLVRGDARTAAELLGRPYRLRGLVGTGQRRGRTIGFPTANLEQIDTLVPRDGVYAVRVHRGQRIHAGAANIGSNPTFGEHVRKVEVHLLDFQGDLLGETLAVDFLDRLRDTRPFAGASELVEQLQRDVELARQIAGRPEKREV